MLCLMLGRRMGKALKKFLEGRDKFSPKKKKEPIHHYTGISRCPAHADGKVISHKKCIGIGCAYFARVGGARELKVSF